MSTRRRLPSTHTDAAGIVARSSLVMITPVDAAVKMTSCSAASASTSFMDARASGNLPSRSSAAPKSAADVRLYELQLHVAALERRQIEREHELGTLVRHTKQFAALEVGRTRREYKAALAEKDAEVDGFRRELDALIDEMGLLVEAAREQAAQAQAAAA